jgi:hypothetical protein
MILPRAIAERANTRLTGVSNCETPTASPRAQAQSRDPAATKQPAGQITQKLSSPAEKNIPLSPPGKSVI